MYVKNNNRGTFLPLWNLSEPLLERIQLVVNDRRVKKW